MLKSQVVQATFGEEYSLLCSCVIAVVLARNCTALGAALYLEGRQIGGFWGLTPHWSLLFLLGHNGSQPIGCSKAATGSSCHCLYTL